VAIRPVIGPGFMTDSAVLDNHGGTVTETIDTIVAPNVVTSPEAIKSADRVASAPQPQMASAPVPRPTEMQVQEVPGKETTTFITTREAERPVRHNSIHSATAQEAPVGVRLHPAPSIPSDTARAVPNQSKTQDTGKAPSQVSIRQRPNSPERDQTKVSPIEPARQSQIEVVRPTQTMVALSSADTPEAARETHNIQVRIGKVEIRSTQPAPVVRAPRRTGTSGFEDLKMARSYFNRAQG